MTAPAGDATAADGPGRVDHPVVPLVLASVLGLSQWGWTVSAESRSLLPGDAADMGWWLGLGWVVVAGLTALSLAATRHSPRWWVVGLGWWPWVAVLATPVVGGWLDLLPRAEGWERLLLVGALGLVCGGLGRRAGPVVVLGTVLTVSVGLPERVAPLALGAPAQAPGPPVVWLTLDTFRADHVRAIDPRSPVETPALDALTERSLVFTQGVAPAPITLPSHAGMLTGQPPTELGMVRNGDVLPRGASTVAEELTAAGWRTGAFVSSRVLDRRAGLSRGFAHYDDRFGPRAHLATQAPWSGFRALFSLRIPPSQRPGEHTIRRALEWLERGDGRSFLWVHLYDAHAPYDPPPGARGATVWPGDLVTAQEQWSAWRETWLPRKGPLAKMRPPSLVGRVEAYAREVVGVDQRVGELVDALPEGTRLVVAADHGESLLEHGYFLNHGRHLFQATTRVPLWVSGPDVVPAVVDHPVPAWAVGDSLRRAAGLPAEHPLEDWVVVQPTEPVQSFTVGQESRPAFGLGRKHPAVAWRVGPQKWIASKGHDTWVFDLESDPDERAPGVADPGSVERGRRLLEALEGTRRNEDDETREWLRELGYVE